MKTLALAFTALSAFALSAQAGAPPVDALRAAQIATDYLKSLGSGAPHIVSITIETSAIFGGTKSWVVKYSESIPGDGFKDIGLRVKFDGTFTRLVDTKNRPGASGAAPQSSVPGKRR